MAKYLVIVESPAKSKTISKFLGPDYEILASYGHVRDLPAAKLGVDVENKFEPTYSMMKGKSKVVKALKDSAKTCDMVYIATDPDREGEAIAWHIVNSINVPEEKIKRIVFHEITKTAIQEAIDHSRGLDTGLVDAQQARRILDRLIGYKLSPILSKKIRKGLSAGRVQSVTVRIICEREDEIQRFVPEEYWVVSAGFIPDGAKTGFAAKLFAQGTVKNPIHLTNETDTNVVLKALGKRDIFDS